jgi:hypothetical protein
MRAITAGVLSLEPQTVRHANEMFAVLGDPAIYEFENQPPASLEWLRTRFGKLESRRSADGTEQWLNWVVRIAGGGLIGYVQATVSRRSMSAPARATPRAGARTMPKHFTSPIAPIVIRPRHGYTCAFREPPCACAARTLIRRLPESPP